MTKKELERFGVSMPSSLLRDFDALIKELGYDNRSEAIRDMARKRLAEEAVDKTAASGDPTFSVLTIVYDHHKPALMERITDLQHHYIDCIISTMHIHMDRYNCVEIVALKGPGKKVLEVTNKLSSLKGVSLGKFIFLPEQIPGQG